MGTVWRPALRCDSAYRDYIDSLSDMTSLDKNQIMRLMLFVASTSEEFKDIISEYKKDDVTVLPEAIWEKWEDGFWLNQTYQKKTGVTDQTLDTEELIPIKKNTGVISFTLPPL